MRRVDVEKFEVAKFLRRSLCQLDWQFHRPELKMESAFLAFDFKGEMQLLGNPKYQTLAGGLFFVQRTCPLTA